MPTGDRYERPQVNIVDRTDGGDWAVRTMGEEVKEKERRARIRDARKRHFSAIVQITDTVPPDQVKSSQRFVGPTNFPGSFLSIHVTWLKCY